MSESFDDAFDRIEDLIGFDDWGYEPERYGQSAHSPVTERTAGWAKKTLQELKYRDWSPPQDILPIADPEGSIMLEWWNYIPADYLALEFHSDGDVIVMVESESSGLEIDLYDKCNRNPRKTADVFEQSVQVYTTTDNV